MKELEAKLDLEKFINDFKKFFSRDRDIDFDGDISQHLLYLKELETVSFNPPPPTIDIWESISAVRKFGVLSLTQIFDIVKIIRYFIYLKGVEFKAGILRDWLEKY